jgi:hypothetical protein
MIVTRKAIPRRTVLRGVGAALALPLLDSMLPAMSQGSALAATTARRLSIVYTPNGIADIPNLWTPAAEGPDFELRPIMAPLAAHRERLVVITGLDSKAATYTSGGGHARASGTFLTGVGLRVTEGADVRAGTSVDQLAAQHLGRETQLSSLELALDPTELVGACDAGYACAYVNTLCWRTPTTPLPMEVDPRAVFERLFGDSESTDADARLRRVRENRSVLDSVNEKLASFGQRIGARDRVKLGEYLDAIRDVERRLQLAEAQNSRELPAVERPAGVPDSYEAHAKVMFDLQVLAFQADLTRVSTLMLAREVSTRPYPEIGVSDPHHPLTHHMNDAEKIAKVAKINVFHTRLTAYYLDRLAATADGDGSLLDHTIVMRGSGMSEGNGHFHNNLPIVLVGGGPHLRGGVHVKVPPGTPVTNLYVTLLDKLGLPIERFGDSTGNLAPLSEI